MTRISNTQVDMYLSCSEKWRLHYKEKLRQDTMGSALFFGLAMDEAFNRLLLDKKKEHTDEEKETLERTPVEIYIDNMCNVMINKESVFLPTSNKAVYYNSDIDMNLVDDESIAVLIEYAEDTFDFDIETKDDLLEFVEQCLTIRSKKNRGFLDGNDLILFNYCCWYSLYEKGLILLAAYEKELYPLIKEVISIQKKVTLEDGDDEYIGYIDFECIFHDEPEKIYTCDNKTSSTKYTEDRVRTSGQLASYCEFTGNTNGAYLVVEKKLRKKEPRYRTQLLRDTISEEFMDEHFDKITYVLESINAEEFEQNRENCFAYGQKCPYFNTCRGNPEWDGLKNMKEKS